MTELCQGPDPELRKPVLDVPRGAVDTHFHLFGPASRYPYAEGRDYTPPDATPATARALFDTLGIERVVIIQASVYGLDNRCQLEQGPAIGLPMRAVVVVPPDESEAELARLHEQGARGVRFNMAFAGGLPPDLLVRYADRMRELGWHIQIMLRPADIVALEARLAALPCPIVIDHMGMIDPAGGVAQPAFQALLRLVRGGRCYVKLSGAYRISRQAPRYPDLAPFGEALVEANPERMLWGSDWPHTHIKHKPPNAADLLDILGDWVPDAGIRHRILVDNPEAFYGF
ncbi:amidohydrolase family protein [Enterovirga rhinocerotis]|uniref:Putative TIM-barrel fold metal-dependent hydrolase n=1 Tax=Enterovirga rhinocerotis TaxID=1339210 RepID=A0A4R7BXA2_9HYPH|nr:amidohydrolase family protein [Enterovirga rhinocerotis]TDR89842.1 putative TIM-barrel fold metal-dependent hydrolase [Enterovirga rhinocerotis]